MLVEDIEFDLSCMDVVGRLAISDGLEEQCFGFSGTEQEQKVRREQWMAIRYQAEYAARYDVPLEISIPINENVSIEFVLIPPGEFMMGSPDDCQYASADEKPQHRVRIANPYWIAKYPVTQAQYEALIGTNPSHFKNDEDSPERPVECVNWYDSREFCNRLTDLLPTSLKGRKVRLPLEAEWEYACRAGTTTLFPWGDSCDGTQANVDGRYPIPNNSPKGPYLGRTCRVGMYAPNHWGVRDMIGQVWEWCLDRYVADAYKKRAEQGVYVVGEGENRGPFVFGEGLGTTRLSITVPPNDSHSTMPPTGATTSASAPLSEGEDGDPFVSGGEDHGSTTPNTAILPSVADSTTVTTSSASDQLLEGENSDPFERLVEAHGSATGAGTVPTLPATSGSASDPLSEGENGFPLGSLGDAISPARLKVDRPLIADGISQIGDTNTTALDPSSEGEESHPFGVFAAAPGTTSLGSANGSVPTTPSTTTASDPLSEGEDRTPFDCVFAAEHGILMLIGAIPHRGIGTLPTAEATTSDSDQSSDQIHLGFHSIRTSLPPSTSFHLQTNRSGSPNRCTRCTQALLSIFLEIGKPAKVAC